MRVKLTIFIGIILALTGCAQTYSSACGCGNDCAQPAPLYPSCQCADPACNGKNPCLDPAKCCRTSGNMGI